MSSVCRGCGKPLPKDRKGHEQYCEDDKGIPFCNSEGKLSDRNREILGRKFFELKVVHAPQTGPYA